MTVGRSMWQSACMRVCFGSRGQYLVEQARASASATLKGRLGLFRWYGFLGVAVGS